MQEYSLSKAQVKHDGARSSFGSNSKHWFTAVPESDARSVRLGMGDPSVLGFAPALKFPGVKFSVDANNNNNVHLSCAHRRPDRSHDTY